MLPSTKRKKKTKVNRPMIDPPESDRLATLVRATAAFVRREVIPVDDEHDGDVHAAGGEALRVSLQDKARQEGLLSPHGPVEYGGLGLGMVDRAPVFEAAGYSLFGPMALNINAPDEGNVHLLEQVATADQRERFLHPLVQGRQRSAFAMTEPAPGAGSDPTLLATRGVRVDGGWLVSGRKWFITGADGADLYIVMARTSGEPGDPGGATMFLAPSSAPGIDVLRHIDTQDRSMLGGHCEMTFTDVFVPDDDVLGAVDEGFRHAQVRLGPARMTHVMRWSGAARRAHEVAVQYVAHRPAFGGRLADLGMVQQQIADNEIDLAATRALLMEACRELDAGGRAGAATSIAKTFAAEALHRVVDRATQLCGGLGVSRDLPVAKIAREVRPFRIYDGPSEVHRWSIAKRAVRRIAEGA
jgi:acyl-CoA dehydrogenase